MFTEEEPARGTRDHPAPRVKSRKMSSLLETPASCFSRLRLHLVGKYRSPRDFSRNLRASSARNDQTLFPTPRRACSSGNSRVNTYAGRNIAGFGNIARGGKGESAGYPEGETLLRVNLNRSAKWPHALNRYRCPGINFDARALPTRVCTCVCTRARARTYVRAHVRRK